MQRETPLKQKYPMSGTISILSLYAEGDFVSVADDNIIFGISILSLYAEGDFEKSAMLSYL